MMDFFKREKVRDSLYLILWSTLLYVLLLCPISTLIFNKNITIYMLVNTAIKACAGGGLIVGHNGFNIRVVSLCDRKD